MKASRITTKKIFKIIYIFAIILSCSACKNTKVEKTIEITDMKKIAELATIECYYHNVARENTPIDNAWYKFWAKDKKRFWIEYSGVVTMGIDANLLDIKIDNNTVLITIPEAQVFNSTVDANSLNDNSYYQDKDSIHIGAEDETYAFDFAQQHIEDVATKDTIQLSNALENAKNLLQNYVNNMGDLTGKKYNIEWNIIKNESEKELKEEVSKKE